MQRKSKKDWGDWAIPFEKYCKGTWRLSPDQSVDLFRSLQDAYAVFLKDYEVRWFKRPQAGKLAVVLVEAVVELLSLSHDELGAVTARLACLPNDAHAARQKLGQLHADIRRLPVVWPDSGVRINRPSAGFHRSTDLLAAAWKDVTGDDPTAGSGPRGSLEFYKFAINAVTVSDAQETARGAFSTLILDDYRAAVWRWKREQTSKGLLG